MGNWTSYEFRNAGTLTTAGNLVFQGRSDGKLLAYNAETGDILWTFDTGLGISAPPITYKINGKQYISLLVGFGGGFARGGLASHKLGWSYGIHTRRLITFSLDGNTDMSELPPPHYPKPIVIEDFEIDEGLTALGENEYWRCSNCHGAGMYGGSMAPDLRASPIPLDVSAFAAVVRDGAKTEMGTPLHPYLTDEQLEALRHFIRQRANETLPEYEELVNPNAANPKPYDEVLGH